MQRQIILQAFCVLVANLDKTRGERSFRDVHARKLGRRGIRGHRGRLGLEHEKKPDVAARKGVSCGTGRDADLRLRF